MTIPDWLRPILSRVIASVVASALAWLARKGIDLGLSDADTTRFTDGVMYVVLSLWGVAYAVIHKAISVRINPTDAASPAIATAATGPLGGGERTALGAKLDAAAHPTEPPKEPPTTSAWPGETQRFSPRPIQPELVQRPPELRRATDAAIPAIEPSEPVTAPPPKPKKPRAPRKKKDPADVIRIDKAPTTDAAGLGFSPPKDNPHSERGDDD